MKNAGSIMGKKSTRKKMKSCYTLTLLKAAKIRCKMKFKVLTLATIMSVFLRFAVRDIK